MALYLQFFDVQQRSRVRGSPSWVSSGYHAWVTGLEVQCDSSLVVNQVSGEYVTRDAQMVKYLQLILILKFKIS